MKCTWLAQIVIALGLAGCGGTGTIYSCPDATSPCGTADAGSVPDASPTLDAGLRTCAGECMALTPDPWSNPLLLWTGPPDQTPPCPSEAPDQQYEGRADPVAPASCTTCTCGPPSDHTCGLPDELTAADTDCADAGAAEVTRISLDPPASWDGSCTMDAPIPAGAMSADGSLSVQSMAIGPFSLTELGCASPAEPPPQPDATWTTAARACIDKAAGSCVAGTQCAPAVPSGYSRCIQQAGDVPCPDGWPVPHLFYGEAEDTRACSPCVCGAPAGGSCTGLISIYNDGVCASKSLQDTVKVSSTSPACVDVQPAGASLGGAQLTGDVTYVPGACAPSGGQAVGAFTPTGPTTFCCQP